MSMIQAQGIMDSSWDAICLQVYIAEVAAILGIGATIVFHTITKRLP
jgi:hypothetical protein